ncbi:unnamed protein product [Symbiodinium sp. CCMP2592]|nr:unnamed protein product [Symbiodinium sp. CCMP2592]CAE7482373.1 unnamed protein product [Symbiodinium sp. CCMP2592]
MFSHRISRRSLCRRHYRNQLRTGRDSSEREPAGNVAVLARLPCGFRYFLLRDPHSQCNALETRNIFADESTGPAECGDSQGVFHAIFHYMVSERDLTSHAWSTDFSGKWTRTCNANVQNVSFTDGTFAKFESRERPDLVVDDAGKPVALATACNAGTSPPEGYMIGVFPILESSEFAVDNAAFTLVQPLVSDGKSTSAAPMDNSTTNTGQSVSSTCTIANAVVLLLNVAWLFHH